MGEVDIRVEGLSKSYRIARGRSGPAYRTLQEELLGLPRRLGARLRRVAPGGGAGDETFWALRDVAFEVRRGEVLGIIGRNGAGKSTLLKILSRITEPTAGRAELHGRVGSLLEVGTGFHPELTGRENIYLSGAILGMRRGEIARRFAEIVAFAEVEQFVDTPVKRYSSGMYMRLAFAVAAHLEPEILIVDEVLAVGDVAFQRKCLGKMGEVARQGRTVLFVSHQVTAVEQLCSRVLMLANGRVEHISADVPQALQRYLSSRWNSEKESRWLNDSGDEFASEWLTPLEFSLTDRDGVPLTMPMRADTEVWVRVRLRISRSDPTLSVGFALYEEGGPLLFWSSCTDTAAGTWPALDPGGAVLTARLPSPLLNEGSYRIELVASLSQRQWLCEPGTRTPTIWLEIQGGLSQSPYWRVRRPGPLAPVLQWENAASPRDAAPLSIAE